MNEVIEVEVTQDYISRGKPGYSNMCPIALALNDATQLPSSADIEDNVAVLYLDGKCYYPIADDQAKVAEFICHFDLGMGVDPIKFKIQAANQEVSDDN